MPPVYTLVSIQYTNTLKIDDLSKKTKKNLAEEMDI